MPHHAHTATQHTTTEHSASNLATAQSQLPVSLCAFKSQRREETARRHHAAKKNAEKKQERPQK